MDGKLIVLSLMLIGLSTAVWGAEAREYVLARDGRAMVSIVLEKNADPLLISAVGELQAYMEKASGARPKIAADDAPVEGLAVHVGRTQALKDSGISFDGIIREGYVISPRPDAILICGATPQGTVQGVYGFLREHIGVRWFRPGDLWEVVPEADPMVVKVSETRINPDYSYRIWSGLSAGGGALWQIRNRTTRTARDIPYYGFGHNLHTILPVSKYGEEHPEYYSEVRGRRLIPERDGMQTGQLCFTNPDVIRLTVEAIRSYFDANPTVTQYSLCINDNPDFCTCEECSKLDMPEVICGHGWRTFSDSYFYYVEQVAKELARTHPDKTVGCYAYWGVESLPRHIKRLPDNVVIALTQDTSQHFDPAFRKYDWDLFLGWKKVAKHVGKYDYYGLGWLSPRYFPHLAAEDLKFSHEQGVDGLYCETYPNLAITGPQLYMAAQLLWDVSQDPDALLDEYMTGLFGEAAPTMHQFYDLMERIWTKERPGMWFQGLDWINNEIINFDAERMTQGLNLLNEAYSQSTGKARERIDDIRRFYRFSYLISAGYETAMSMQDLPLESRADASRLASEMKRTVSLASLAERTWRTTLMSDPVHGGPYYSDVIRFWNKFGGWQERVMGESMAQLIRLQQWTEKNMPPADAERLLNESIREMERWKVTRGIDFRDVLTPARQIPRAGDIRIDGRRDDWAGMSWMPIEDTDGGRVAEFALAWDTENLYLACSVNDAVHHQQWDDAGIWQEDSIQIGIDTLRDAWRTRTFAADDHEYGFALTKSGPVVWCWQGELGRVTKIPVEIVRSGDNTFYEAAIPWAILKPLRPSGGEIIGVSVLVNNSDGGERQCYEWSGGLAWTKNPRLFAPMRLFRE